MIDFFLVKKFFMLCLLLSSVGSRVSGMSISIHSDELVYGNDEEILIYVRVINDDSSVTMIVPLLFIPEDYFIRFIIVDSSGQNVQFIGAEYDWIESELDLLRMPPKSFFLWPIRLADYYLLLPGEYSIQVIYDSEAANYKEHDVWAGKIYSNIINIIILQ